MGLDERTNHLNIINLLFQIQHHNIFRTKKKTLLLKSTKIIIFNHNIYLRHSYTTYY